jgi:hypothetical protein
MADQPNIAVVVNEVTEAVCPNCITPPQGRVFMGDGAKRRVKVRVNENAT